MPMLLALIACHSPPEDKPPEGLDPLEENLAPYPDAVGGDDTPEVIALASSEQDEYDQTHGRGFVDMPVADVITAFRTVDVGVDRRRVASWETEYDTAPDYDVSYTTTNYVEDPIAVDFDITWGHGASKEDADGAAALWSKTDGTEFVFVLEGFGQVLPVDDSTTEVQLIYHLSTVSSGTEDVEEYVTDFFYSIVAASHGDALPTYE